MKQSWLIVTNISTESKNATLWDKILTVYATGHKASRLALQYQNELNEGRTMEECVKQNKDFLSVCPIPWSQARDYGRLRDIIDNIPEFKPKEA